MLETWMSFGGVEVIHNARAMAYVSDTGAGDIFTGNKCRCDTLPEAFGDPDYVTPELDPAPWYDASDPRSERFFGFFATQIEGILDSPVVREVTQRVTDGAVTSCPRYTNKELTVTGWIFAQDACGADYGVFWLRQALMGARCSGCGGDDMCLLACCPTDSCDDDDGTGEGEGEGEGEGGSGEGAGEGESGGEDSTPDGEECFDTDTQLRTMKNAALLSGPDVVRTAPGYQEGICLDGARPFHEVQFQISVDPYFWRQPVTLAEYQPWPLPTGDEVCNITWNDSGDCDPDDPDCVPGANVSLPGCAVDDLCPPPPPPPRVPAATTSCVCLPLQVVRQCHDIPANTVPAWMDAGLRFEIYSGDTALRNLSIRVWENPTGKSPSELDECHTLGVYYVPFVPPTSTLVIDGQSETTMVQCPSVATRDADAMVYGPGAGPLQFTTLSCATPHTICADVDTEFIDPLATLSVELIPREV